MRHVNLLGSTFRDLFLVEELAERGTAGGRRFGLTRR